MKKRQYYLRRGIEPRLLQTKNAIIRIAAMLAVLAGVLAAPPAIAQTVTLDTLIVYTPAARVGAYSYGGIQAVTDLMVAETNQAFRDSGLNVRVRMVGRREIAYVESVISDNDLRRIRNREDGYMDEVHRWRFQAAADFVHLIADSVEYCGHAYYGTDASYAFAITDFACGSRLFAHELGHNLNLRHDRYQELKDNRPLATDGAYGYVNQRAFDVGAFCWYTIMAYSAQCYDAGIASESILRFSNPRQYYQGYPLGVHFGVGGLTVAGAADAVSTIAYFAPIHSDWYPRRPPHVIGAGVADLTLPAGSGTTFDLRSLFRDPLGGSLAGAASSDNPSSVRVSINGNFLGVTAFALGTATIRVVVVNEDGQVAEDQFRATVRPEGFIDDPIQRGITLIRPVHFTELRARIDAVRVARGLGAFSWTDPALRAGAPVKLAHLLDLRNALAGAYQVAGRIPPTWTDPVPEPGETLVKAVHINELRRAVIALE